MQAAAILQDAAGGSRLRNFSVMRSVISGTSGGNRLSDTDSIETPATGLSDDSLRGKGGAGLS